MMMLNIGEAGEIAGSKRSGRASRRALALSDEVAAFLLENNGPTSEGRIHLSRRGVDYSTLLEALEKAKGKGLHIGWRCFHARNIAGLYKTAPEVEEMLLRSVQYLLRTKFRSSIFVQVTTAEANDFRIPFIDQVGDRQIAVSTHRLLLYFDGSPYKMIKRYLLLQRQFDLAEQLKPFMFLKAGQATSSKSRDELIELKIGCYLKRNASAEDQGAFFQQVKSANFHSPVSVPFDGQDVRVSVRQAIEAQANLFDSVWRLLELRGLSRRFEGLRPYHLPHTTSNTYADPKLLDEVVVVSK